MRPLAIALALGVGACATRPVIVAPQDPVPPAAVPQDPEATDPSADPRDADAVEEPQDDAATPLPVVPFSGPGVGRGEPNRGFVDDVPNRPWKLPRMEHPGVLRQGQFEALFAFEKNDETAAFRSGLNYGVTDRFTVQGTVGTGHQPDTLFVGEEPGVVFDMGGQYALNDPAANNLYAARLDVVLSDEESFEAATQANNRTTDSKVNFQPSFLAGWNVDGRCAVFAELGGRIGESNDPAFVAAGAISIPIEAVTFLLEVDGSFQDDADEVYVTPGLVFNPRERIQLRLSPSIGLTEESLDWRVMAMLGVRF